MYFTIQDELNNKPILRGKLKGFGTHTAVTESNRHNNNAVAFYACLSDIEVLNPELLKKFEDLYRIDNNPEWFTNANTEKRTYYVFSQPKLRSEFIYIITQDGYK